MPRPAPGYASSEYFSIMPPTGLMELLAQLENPETPLNAAAQKILEKILSVIEAYPPPRPTYQRTMKLQNSWHIPTSGVTGDELGRVRSDGPYYNVYVKDKTYQSKIHAGRHLTVADVSDDSAIAAFAVEVLDVAYQQLINKAS